MENREKVEEGICIMSFDGGGPGSMSQLRILEEVMIRLAFESDVPVDELRPSDYFDLMGGVGFGGFVALLLGRLRMTIIQAAEELATIGTMTFPECNDMSTPSVNMARLRKAIESMLERHGHSVDMKLRENSDNRCKVVLFAATTAVMDHCHPFRTYRSPRKCPECTLVDAACATMATLDYFSSVTIGPRLRKQTYAGIPYGFDNPMREALKECQLVFGDERPVSLVFSLGSGQRARLSDQDHHVTRLSRARCDGVARNLQHQLCGFTEYLRLNVDRGMEKVELNDWSNLGSIEDHTEVYLGIKPITNYVDKAVKSLLKRNGSVTLGRLSGTSSDRRVKFDSETLDDYLAMEFKQMHNIIQELGIEKITLVDAIGNPIPIPIGFCLTYTMLLDVIGVYFKHQKAPGSDFVERGDYRLVHGSRRNIVDQMQWARIEKAGLRVEMSMILRTRNEDKVWCPRCRARFEGSDTDGWVQCLSCSGQFQIETKVQAGPQVEPDDRKPGLVTAEGFKSREPLMREYTISGETGTSEFRLISVINLLEVMRRQAGVENTLPNVPSQTPQTKRDALREKLKTLADRNRLTFISEEYWDQQGFWWSFYYLTNPDGSKRDYLGSGCGTDQIVAKEYAAMQSHGALTTLITTRTKNVAASSAASTDAAVSAHTDSGNFWSQQLKILAKENNLGFTCDLLQDSQRTYWATYHLSNPDGSRPFQLGSRGAAALNIAMEHAAHDSVETLNRLVAILSKPGTAAGSSGAGGSSS